MSISYSAVQTPPSFPSHVMMEDKQHMPEPDTSMFLEATAYWTASVRAAEHARDDRLVDDPWAEALAGEVGAAWIATRTADWIVPIVLRTRYFDDCLKRVVTEENIHQVVLMAAGLDTRAYRLAWPEKTHLFELDQPAILDYKARILANAQAQPTCRRTAIGVDLASPWKAKLLEVGFDDEAPTAWLLEGFLFYLPNEVLAHILDTVIAFAAPGSWMGFDIINSTMLTHPLTKGWIEMQAASGAPWIGTLDDPGGYLAARGWAASLTQAGQPDASYGRWPHPVLPTMMPNVPHNWFVTARKGG